MNILSKGLLLCCLILFTNCFNRWSEDEHRVFDADCAKTKAFSNEVILFRGYDNTEFDSITVKEYKKDVLLDTFKIYVWPASGRWDIDNKSRRATIEKNLNIDYEYHFIVPGHEFVLKDMKMVKWAQYTGNSEGWGCEMGNFTIDGVKYEHTGNVQFIKPGYSCN